MARVTGPISRPHPIQVEDVKFLRANTDHQIKVTVPGPFTMSQQAQDDFYGDPQALAFAYADAVNAEVVDLFAAGADIVQLDEPYLQARPEPARQYGLSALNRALDGVLGTTAVHLCFGYAAIIHERPSGYSFLPELADCSCDQISIETAQSNLDTAVLAELTGKTIILGGIDLSDPVVETAETVADRVRRALPYVAPDKVIVATDCGMKYLPRQSALGKMQAMSGAAQLLQPSSAEPAAGAQSADREQVPGVTSGLLGGAFRAPGKAGLTMAVQRGKQQAAEHRQVLGEMQLLLLFRLGRVGLPESMSGKRRRDQGGSKRKR
ncbi:MAG TPA: uroporphyrinogen decarboxylase family protein [Mycobacteriales bacterium]|nr:uroporphyrinogen decarboxylase family protein [Mycobacteriales bacterium]